MRENNAHFVVPELPFEGPVWLRLPAPRTRCHYTGLSRTSLLELCAPCQRNSFQPPVVSKVVRKRGAIRGIRLICFNSLMTYLRALED